MPQAIQRPPLLAYLCLASSMALVGSYVGLSKLLVTAFPVFLLAWLRFGIAAVAMAGWVRRRPGEPALTRRDRVLLFWESFLGNFLFSIAMLFGVSLSTALAAGIVMAALPGVVAVLSRVFLGERIAPRVLVGIAFAVGGIALVSLGRAGAQATSSSAPPGAGGAEPLWGHVLLVLAVLCEASYVVIGKKLSGNVSPKRISALVNLWGLALVTPFGLWQMRGFDFSSVASGTWALLVFYAIAASMVTVWLWMTGLRHVPAASAGVFTVMLPIATAAVGVALLGERLTGLQAVAFLLALAGLLLATLQAPPKAPATLRRTTP